MNDMRTLTESALWSHAWSLLRRSHLLRPFSSQHERHGKNPRFISWEDSFESSNTNKPYSMTVFEPSANKSEILLARYAEWSSEYDLREIRKDINQETRVSLVYEPTVMIADFSVKKTLFLPLFQNLCHSSLPSIVELEDQNDKGMNFDGARMGTTGFEILSRCIPPNRFTAQWSSYPPDSWQALITSFKHVRGFLFSEMKEQGVVPE
ncbi:MAG: hypothetical protein ACIAZJ_20180 [Gimesia chilikensis]|uniref:hypothetical protein n=1 Tax=Gimesia chilikensis TaxID=2605989 RepID=UPI0037AF8503